MIVFWRQESQLNFDDSTYFKAYDHNYRVAYEESLAFSGEGGSQWVLRRLEGMLRKITHSPPETRILDMGCGDGTVGLFLAGLGYRYLGIDISDAAIVSARQRCAEAGAGAKFKVANALVLDTLPAHGFDIVLDCFCFNNLAKAFSHRPSLVTLSDPSESLADGLNVKHDGVTPGILYTVSEAIGPEDIYPHPHPANADGWEWLVWRELKPEFIERTVVSDHERLTDEEIANLRRKQKERGEETFLEKPD